MDAHFDFDLGTTLIDWRTREKLSQEDAATILNVSVNTYRRWEGSQTFPSMARVPELCNVIRLSPNRLFGMKGFEDANL